ncbi:MAG: hypothetical protein H0U70_06800 [Tatlockia sp.]|nr:hypothetical protein [Tatlockia sp.]
MFVHRIKEFIESLFSIKEKLGEKDLELLTLLEERFGYNSKSEYPDFISHNLNLSSQELPLSTLWAPEFLRNKKLINDDRAIDEEDTLWIKELFQRRWLNISNTFEDYTFYSGGINAPWIAFARDLAVEIKIPYLKILIPILANTHDPNNFSRLDDVPEPRSIYLSDNNTWHRLKALYEEVNKTHGVFGIRDKFKSKKQRPLSLNELYRIRSKRGEDTAFTAKNGLTYSGFWDYIKREVAPRWQNDEACLDYFLPDLLDLIEKYCCLITDPTFDYNFFKISIKNFIKFLAKRPLAEVNSFYGVKIQINDEHYLLVEILLDLIEENKEKFNNKVLYVAKWISKVNPALVSQNKNLKSAYKMIATGSISSIKYIRELIFNLNINNSSLVKSHQTKLLNILEQVINNNRGENKEFLQKLVAKIEKMYALRWDKIIDTVYDYTCMQKGINQAWILLSQYLAGAGYLEHLNRNYYRLLMPTLRHNYDCIKKELLTVYPLNHYFLSNNDQELILIDNCLENFETNGTFRNCNFRIPKPLSHKERTRLMMVNQKIYAKYILRMAEKLSDEQPISKSTVDALKELITRSLNPNGLIVKFVSPEEYENAFEGYRLFLYYLSQMSDEEKNNFYNQKISLGSYEVNVQEIFEKVQNPNYEKRECVALHGRYLIQLVINYAPRTKFLECIEDLNLSSMRAASTKRVYSDFNGLTQDEAIKRILIVITSLMTHSFQYLWFTGVEISIGNHSNAVTETGSEIYSLVKEIFEPVDEELNFRFLYAQLMKHIVEPAICTKKPWSRYQDTDNWLGSLQDGSIFNDSHEKYFDPEILAIALWSFAKASKKLSEAVEKFLNQLYGQLISIINPYKKWVIINIECDNFLKSEEIFSHRPVLIKLFKQVKLEPSREKLFIQTSKEFFIHRLALLGSQNPNYKIGFYGASPGKSHKLYECLREDLTNRFEIALSTLNANYTLDELLFKLQQITGLNARKDFTKYLHDVANNIPIEQISNSLLS